MADRDSVGRRQRKLASYQRRVAERVARGMCPKCGQRPIAASASSVLRKRAPPIAPAPTASGPSVRRGNQDETACCLIQECSRALRCLPHVIVPQSCCFIWSDARLGSGSLGSCG